MAESYETVDKFAQENVKLAEEKRMLEEILNINQMYEEELGLENEEIIANVIIIPDDENPFDDAVIEAYIKQSEEFQKRRT